MPSRLFRFEYWNLSRFDGHETVANQRQPLIFDSCSGGLPES